MKKLLTIGIVLMSLFILSACDDIDDFVPNDIPEITINTSEMIQVLSTGRNNFMPDMNQLNEDISTGDILERDSQFLQNYYCSPVRNTVENEDGTFTETYAYYDYDYDYYEKAYEMLYNGIDDDDDGEIDEDDEILLMVTEEMQDGIDNNNNGIIDEYFEMTPTYYVTYTITYNEGTYTTTTEDGVTTTTGSFFYEWTETRAPYTGQVINLLDCYFYNEDTNEDSDGYVDEDVEDINDERYQAYEKLLLEIQEALSNLSLENNRDLGILYAELTLGRPFTEEEKSAIETIWDLYEDININSDSVNEFDSEIEYLEFYLDRSLSDLELEALEIVSFITSSQNQSVTLDQLIQLYESILGRSLSDLEKEALALFESYE